MLMQKNKIKNKEVILAFIRDINDSDGSIKHIEDVHFNYFSEDLVLNVTHPFQEMKGLNSVVGDFWSPLVHSFPDLEIIPYILMGGEFEGQQCVTTTGNMIGTFQNDWLGVPSTKHPLWIRFAAHFVLENGQIERAWYFLDMLDVFRQAGFNFFPNRGIEWVPNGPMTGDGIITYPTDDWESQKSMDLTNAMLDGLGSYDGKSLSSMGQEEFWDVKNMMWYGPSGIGTTRGLKGFQDNHQLPFLKGFPDRGITEKEDQHYVAQYGDGNYSCDFGFPSMYGTHLGDGWLGLKATGKRVYPRVIDFWRREGNRLKENWVFIDMLDILKDFGIDVFELMKEQQEEIKK